MFFDFQSSKDCLKQHKGYALVTLPHRFTDQVPGGTGAAGPWPPVQASVRNPSHHNPRSQSSLRKRTSVIKVMLEFHCRTDVLTWNPALEPHRCTDLEPGGTGAAGPWPPAQASVRNPSQCDSGSYMYVKYATISNMSLVFRYCTRIDIITW